MSKIDGFTPMQGCMGKCPIEKKEKGLNSEICCMGGARQCCFTCFDIECPIKEEYRDIIFVYGGVVDIDD